MIYAIEALGSRGGCPHGGKNLGLVKIGKANTPKSRVKVLGTGSPHPLRLLCWCDWPDEIERLVHAAFKDIRVYGEWFSPDGSMTSFVSTMMCPNGADDDQKYAACMTILVERLSGWNSRPDMEYGQCRAPDMRQTHDPPETRVMTWNTWRVRE